MEKEKFWAEQVGNEKKKVDNLHRDIEKLNDELHEERTRSKLEYSKLLNESDLFATSNKKFSVSTNSRFEGSPWLSRSFRRGIQTSDDKDGFVAPIGRRIDVDDLNSSE